MSESTNDAWLVGVIAARDQRLAAAAAADHTRDEVMAQLAALASQAVTAGVSVDELTQAVQGAVTDPADSTAAPGAPGN